MALPTASDNVFPKVIISEAAAPASPSAGQFKLYVDSSDHILKYKNSSGTVVPLGQGVADGGTIGTYLDFTTGAAPSSPAAGKIRIYSKTGDHLYQKDSGGTETALDSTGGGGASVSVLGYNTAGGSFRTMTNNRWYCKKVTTSGAGVIVSIGAYIQTQNNNTQTNMSVAVLDDNSNAPGKFIAQAHQVNGSEMLTEGTLSTLVPRFVDMPIGAYISGAGSYWIAIATGGGGGTLDVAYDATVGSDQYFTPGGYFVADAGGGLYALTTTTDKHSIRCVFIG